jgi:hypothetical protein
MRRLEQQKLFREESPPDAAPTTAPTDEEIAAEMDMELTD